jgi:hypothetical protein
MPVIAKDPVLRVELITRTPWIALLVNANEFSESGISQPRR